MKRNKFLLLFGTALLGMVLASCGTPGAASESQTGSSEGGSTTSQSSESVPDLNVQTRVRDFATGDGSDDFFASSGFGNGDPFNVTWNASNAVVEENELHLKISQATSGEYPYYGGEIRSLDFYGYGDYGVKMKPAKGSGTASTFFTYTGEWDSETKHPSTGKTDTRNPDNEDGIHDEIDIEFLGKDTTRVQFNYFTNGRGGNEYMYDLGFDASEEWHYYGFRWEQGRITWFVDGKAVYSATTNIPTHPGRIIANYWTGTERAAGWMGNYDPSNTSEAVYQWFSADADHQSTHKADPEPVTPTGDEINWDEISAVDFTDLQGNVDTYTAVVASDKKSVDVTYTNVAQNYNNINFAVPSEVSEARTLSFKVENKGTEAVAVRGNANAATAHGEHNIYAVNASAKQDGNAVNTDTEWGGSFFSIEGGATALCEITYSEAISRLEFMIDSHVAGEQSGHIVISDLKFSSSKAPEEELDWDKIEASDYADLQGNTDTYTAVVAADAKSVDVTYTGVGQNYNNINFAIPASASEARVLSFKVENKGTEAVAVRGNANAATAHGEHNIYAVNASAKQDGVAVNTDMEWGGSFFVIEAGATALCEITYSEALNRIEFMIDSHIAGEQSGHIVLSDLKFATSTTPETPTQDEVDWSLVEATELTDLQGNVDTYTAVVASDKKSVDVTYTNIAQNYNNINFAIPASASEARVLSFKVQNLGEATVAVRGNANASTTHGEHNIYAVNASAKQDGVTVNTDMEWGGSFFSIAAGTTSLCEITYSEALNRIEFMIDSHVAGEQSGHVVISDLKFAIATVPETPEQPEAVTLNFSGDGYVCQAENGVSTITYESIKDGTYKNVTASIAGLVPEGATKLSFKLTNNGEEKVQINVDIRGASGETSYFVQNAAYDWFDTGAHRVQYNVNAGESRVLDFYFDFTGDAVPTTLLMFVNSGWAEVEVTHTNGNFTISEVSFSVVAE